MKAIAPVVAGLFMCALGLSTSLSAAAAARGQDDKDVTLKGCLVKGEGDGSGYLLTNTPAEPDWQRSADTNLQPGAVGTSGGFESVFYWLDGDNDLKTNIGHQVEIRGDLKGDLKDGEIRIDRKDNWTELTVKSDGRSMKANVPNASMFPSPREEKDRKVHVLVRKVDVEKVTMLSASCGEPR
jgi:hypothetical protein